MRKDEKRAILQDGNYALDLVRLDPDRYMVTLGSYLENDTTFGMLIRWHQRGEASHSSAVFICKKSMKPVLEIHALEGWGVIATQPAVLAKKKARVEIRLVKHAPSAKKALEFLEPKLGADYEKPFGFITKKIEDNPFKFFCSELMNLLFKLLNCPSCLVSPPWLRRSNDAKKVLGYIYADRLEDGIIVGAGNA